LFKGLQSAERPMAKQSSDCQIRRNRPVQIAMKHPFFPSALFAVICLLAGQAPAADLVSNGSFEGLSVPASPGYSCFSGSAAAGWIHSAGLHGSCYILGNTGGWGAAYNGTQFMYLNDFGTAGTSIEQTLGLTAGTTYLLSFAVGGFPGTPVGQLNVELGSFSTTVTQADSGWSYYDFLVTPASTGSAALRFTSLSNASVTIDAVSVASVPEPAAALMWALGLGSALLLKTRRR
jgi:hypothetical protein